MIWEAVIHGGGDLITLKLINNMKSTYISVLVVGVVIIGAIFLIGKDSEGTNNDAIQSHRSYSIKLLSDTSSLKPNTPTTYSFSVVDEQGTMLKDFQIAHDMLLHLIVVREDLAEFQHVHPDFNSSTGVFTLNNLTFPTAGQYRIYADFVPSSSQMGEGGMPLNVVLDKDVNVGGSYSPQSLSVSAISKHFDNYEVSLSTNPKSLTAGSRGMFSFAIKKDGKLITDLQPYLSALGHSVVIREGTLDYIHAHAVQEPSVIQNGTIDFHTDFPYDGKYKVFTQFKHQEKVITTNFVIDVKGDNSEPTPMERQHMMPDDTMMHN